MDREQKVYTLCGMCGSRCPVEVTMEQGKPRWLCGNPHVPPGTPLCPRGAAGIAMHDDEKRVTYPMVRQGERGAGMWREATWDEALSSVTDQLRQIISQHGAQSVLFAERPGAHSALTKAFARGLGTPNYCNHGSTCFHNINEACYSVTGRGCFSFLYDYANCKALVLQGRNIFEALTVPEVNAVLNGMEQGCKTTVIDVRTTITACKAQRFWQIRPGTDYALNLAVIHVLLRDGLYNEKSLNDLDGLEELNTFAQPYTPEWASQQCGIPAQAIVDLARELAAAAPAVIWHPGWMGSRYTQSLMLARSAYIINALLGSFGAQGGLVPAPAPRTHDGKGLTPLENLFPAPDSKKDPQKNKRLDGVGSELPHFDPAATLVHRALGKALSGIPYAPKAALFHRLDPLTSLPDPEQVKILLNAIPLVVSLTDTWSETAWYSDVVLPLTPYLENNLPLFARPDFRPRLFMPRAAMPPLLQCRPDWKVISDLAERLGIVSLRFSSIEEIWQYQLKGAGFSLTDFKATGFVSLRATREYPAVLPLPTPSGKLEMRSRRWSEAGVDSLRPYEEVRAPLEGEFRLITGRVAQHTQAHTQNNALLAAQFPEPVAWIHPSRAAQLKIKDGEKVSFDPGPRSKKLLRVRVTEDIHPEALFLPHGFGHKLPMERRAYGMGVADQELMPGGLELVDSCGMAPALQEHFVKLYKLQQEDE